MIPIRITLDIEATPWDDIDADKLLLNADRQPLNVDRIAGLPRGTVEGNPVVMFGMDLDDGRHVVAQTSWRNLYLAVVALQARYGVPE